ncbi:uncharacterized protein LOC109861985 isoform X2 [Pseudomyrmex gracilis]|uniref:uncharacterized protein LOC109861985 isoform X2 n=1 Tax=Pseudomyrmex gracilis TaxID=219809 RepID=UPI000994E6EE|nr:uncharacterized protein LOC109861985 isoform X2 [Pseudomyrmex gracilis]
MTDGNLFYVLEFENELQVIPSNWLDERKLKVKWPNFKSDSDYYKAVMFMMDPKSDWTQHHVKEIYASYSDYSVARKKLEEVKQFLLDLNSNTEKEENLKKSRKIRDAKIIDTSASSNEELSDDNLTSELPKIPISIEKSTKSTKKESDNSQSFAIRKLKNFEVKLNQIENNMNTSLEAILQKLSISNIEEDNKQNIDVFDNLPLKNENELQLMELKLKNDICYRKCMIEQLKACGTDDLRKSCRELMKTILSNEVAVRYSWNGTEEKKAFSQLEICKVIMSIIRKLHTNVTNEEIASPIKTWLNNAKERMKKKKPQVTQQQEEEDSH